MSNPSVVQPRAYHVLAHDSGWEVRADGSGNALGCFEGRDEAIAVARDAVEAAAPAQLVVHNPDGSVASQWPTDEAFALRSDIDPGDLAAEASELGDEDFDRPADDDGDLE